MRIGLKMKRGQNSVEKATRSIFVRLLAILTSGEKKPRTAGKTDALDWNKGDRSKRMRMDNKRAYAYLRNK
uniref:Ribosomal protein S13 n=1 Tax=Panagrellus redivivus TaxID=6233 RepID=A0A7E4VJZ8_PANRE